MTMPGESVLVGALGARRRRFSTSRRRTRNATTRSERRTAGLLLHKRSRFLAQLSQRTEPLRRAPDGHLGTDLVSSTISGSKRSFIELLDHENDRSFAAVRRGLFFSVDVDAHALRHPLKDSRPTVMRLVTLGVGAQKSPRYAPAGLLVAHRGVRVMLDGGPAAEPPRDIDAWLLTDEQAELKARIRSLARGRNVEPHVAAFSRGDLSLEPHPVVHTSHPSYGYLICADDKTVVWAPEFLEFPRWAAGADLMFAEAASWNRPIYFKGRVGGHLHALAVAAEAKEAGVKRLVLAHIGRPTIRARDSGELPPFGEFASDGQVFYVR
jgi:hypothetical protein